MDEYELLKPKRKKWPWIVGILAILILLMAGGIYLLSTFSMSLSLNGPAETLVQLGESYEDEGVQVNFRGTLLFSSGADVDADVTVDGVVEPETIGTYTLSYRAEFLLWKAEAQRTVHVVDREAPVILLQTNPEYYTLPGGEYVEEGFSAYDNYDGEITQKVIRTEEEGRILYEVSDSFGNTTSVTRTIAYDDPIPPELTLAGDETVKILAGDSYEEPGYTALDNCDGDISQLVEVFGSVQRYLPGSYQLDYRVLDSYGNEATASRTVLVEGRELPERVTPSGRVIYLTFDDGPGPYTEQLLAVLARYNVKATFFVVNGKYNHLLKKIHDGGHAIGMHSYSHTYKTIYASEEAFFEDELKMQSIIKDYTGEAPKILRFPGGGSNTVSRFNPGIMYRLTLGVKAMGWRYFDWNVDSDDAGKARTADEVYENVIKGIPGYAHAVVLQHDTKSYSVAAVERIIEWGLANGYRFLPLDTTSPIFHHSVVN